MSELFSRNRENAQRSVSKTVTKIIPVGSFEPRSLRASDEAYFTSDSRFLPGNLNTGNQTSSWLDGDKLAHLEICPVAVFVI